MKGFPEMIPVNEPLLDGNEKRYLAECVKTGWISSEGPFVRKLEEGFAARVGRRHGIAVCNGSVALDVAIAALDIGRGDEVILPSFTIISCAAAIVRAGATPVLVDCEDDTWNTTADRIADRITPRTKAIMIVHIYGLPVDMDPVFAVAQQHGLRIIEDAAEMHGQTYKGRPCGSLGDVSTFSFYPNKLVTTGEGGMVLTDDSVVAERCQALRNLCFPVSRTAYAENIYWVFGVVLDDHVPFDAAEAMRRLAAQGVGTRPFFWPMHEQPVLRKMGLFAGEAYPNAERLARRGFYLPSGLSLTEPQIDRVAATVRELMQ